VGLLVAVGGVRLTFELDDRRLLALGAQGCAAVGKPDDPFAGNC
jgi:hypothetical protein